MNKRIFAWSGVMMLLAAIFVWGMTGHPKAAGENSDKKAQVVSGASVSGGLNIRCRMNSIRFWLFSSDLY